MDKRGEIAPQEQFVPFSTIPLTYFSNYRSQITYSFVKFGYSIGIFLHSANLICRSTDIFVPFSTIPLPVRISRSVSDGPFDFEITRVDCIYLDVCGCFICSQFIF